MSEDPGHTDDISQLWGADDNGAWEPAPLRRPVRPVEPARLHAPRHGNGTGTGQADRLEALERDVHALVRVVVRVDALVNERLSRLEQQVEELASADDAADADANSASGPPSAG